LHRREDDDDYNPSLSAANVVWHTPVEEARAMPGWGVIPSIRVDDMRRAVAFYTGQLEFTLDSGGDEASNSSLTRGDGHVMIETAADFYSDQYNEAIRERLGKRSSIALYIEAEDLADFYSRLEAGNTVRIVDPLAARPWGQEEFTVEDHEGNWLTFWNKPL
jgi:uncharacterized glyoxalase superfamily protein PhnB